MPSPSSLACRPSLEKDLYCRSAEEQKCRSAEERKRRGLLVFCSNNFRAYKFSVRLDFFVTESAFI